MEDLVKKYNEINNSFKKKLVFHVGVEAGFYSEINNMLIAMMYCLKNKIRFSIYAEDANFANNKGWEEFFLPFCELIKDDIHHVHNFRTELPKKKRKKMKYRIKMLWYKFFYHFNYFTYDLWKKFFNDEFFNTNLNVKEFGINGTPMQEFGKIIDIAMRYNAETKRDINNLIKKLDLPEKYLSLQIRGGDKTIEAPLIEIDKYLQKYDELGVDIKDVFVFTDDYVYVEELKLKRPDFRIYTLTDEDEKGYVNSDFNNMPWEVRRKGLIKLFANVEICINANLHLASPIANPTLYILSNSKNAVMIEKD